MKRLHFIYLAAPLTVALNSLPAMLGGVWSLVLTVVLAIALWSVVWIRLFTNKKLRPEFAIMAVVPAASFYILKAAGPEYQTVFSSPGWQNFNFFLWLASIAVIIRALLPTAQEHHGRLATDSVLIFMSIISIFYGIFCWANIHASLIG